MAFRRRGAGAISPRGFARRLCATVGADLKLSHGADSKMSQGWKPTLKGMAVDKSSYLSSVVSSLAASAAGSAGLRSHLELPQT